MLLFGSVLDRPPGPKYAASLGFAELALRDPLPRIPTLRKQRGGLGAAMKLALRAPKAAVSGARGPMRVDESLERGIEWLLQAQDALQAAMIVLPTPPELTPGARSRALLAAYVERLRAATDATLVWAPRGPWDAETAAEVAQQNGLTLAFDPMVDPRPEGPAVYARLTSLGVRRSFADAALEQALETILEQPTSELHVAIDSDRSFQQAQRMQALHAELYSAT